ncbi:MAG: hypothetical protein IJW41_02765 [Oscillospiraceae bacterium]|nr:hypothetical protein [Oscillospiraceae bacterium]
MNKIVVGWMYPNLLNLHGERGSVQALERIGKKMGVEIEILRIEDFTQPIPFEKLDLMIFLPGEICLFPHLVAALKDSGLEEYLNNDGHLLAIGTSGLMFGNAITREDGSTLEGLGHLDMTAKERKYVWGDDLHLRINATGQELIGSQIQMADVDAKEPLAATLYGMGNNNTGVDGARYKNLIYTNCLGPLFVKNPWFAETIINEILEKKGQPSVNAEPDLIAQQSFASTLAFIKKKQSS